MGASLDSLLTGGQAGGLGGGPQAAGVICHPEAGYTTRTFSDLSNGRRHAFFGAAH